MTKKRVKVYDNKMLLIGHEECMELDESGKPKPLKAMPIIGGDGDDKWHWEWREENNSDLGRDKELWTPDNGYDNKYNDGEEFIEYTEEQMRLGQSYDIKPAEKIKCKICGGYDFNVGAGSYLTVISCSKCKWEYAIHDG